MRHLGAFIIAGAMCFGSFADVMVLHKADGSTERIRIADITEMSFTNSVAVHKTGSAVSYNNACIVHAEGSFLELTVARTAPVSITMYTVTGKSIALMKSRKFRAGTYRITLSEMLPVSATGVYILKFTVGRDQFISKTIRL